MDLENRLREILKGIDPDINVDNLTRETDLKEELGLSSVGLLYMAVAIEDEFKINLGNESLGQIRTIGDVIAAIESHNKK